MRHYPRSTRIAPPQFPLFRYAGTAAAFDGNDLFSWSKLTLGLFKQTKLKDTASLRNIDESQVQPDIFLMTNKSFIHLNFVVDILV